MYFLSKMLLFALPSIFLVWSGINAVKTKKANFGRGYCRWTGKKAVILGYSWIVLGLALFVLGLLLIR